MADSNLTLVLVDDEPAHSTLVKRNLKKCGLKNEMIILSSGQQLLDYVFSKAQFENREPLQKAIILLDINMPGMSGIEALKTLKTNDLTRKIPVFMLTTTDDPVEVEECFRLGCNAYLTKPIEHAEFATKIQELGHFIMTNQIPSFL